MNPSLFSSRFCWRFFAALYQYIHENQVEVPLKLAAHKIGNTRGISCSFHELKPLVRFPGSRESPQKRVDCDLRDILRRVVCGGLNSRNDSGSGNLKALSSSLSYPLDSEAPSPWSCELRVAPVANWHNRQPGIIHQLMRQPPNARPMGLGICTIWRQDA